MTTFADTGLRYVSPVTVNSRERVIRSETLNLKTQTVSNNSQRWDMTIRLEPIYDRDGDFMVADLSRHRATKGLSKSFKTAMPQYPNTESAHDADIEEQSAGDAPDWDDTDDFPVGHQFIKFDIVTRLNSDSNYEGFVALQDHVKSNNNGPTDSTDNWERITTSDGDPLVSRAGDSRLVVVNNDTDVTLHAGRFINFGNHDKVYMVTETIFLEEDAYKLLSVFPPLQVSAESATILHHDDVQVNVLYAADGQEGFTVVNGTAVDATVSLIEKF